MLQHNNTNFARALQLFYARPGTPLGALYTGCLTISLLVVKHLATDLYNGQFQAGA